MKAGILVGVSGLALSALFASPSFAQTAPAPEQPAAQTAAVEAAESDAIIVTGSRIPRPQFEGNIPGAQITGQDIQDRGFTNLVEALNDLPLVGPGASPIGNAGGQPASLGAAFVDLLDLGTNRTLSLVNGRRFVSGNAGSLFVAGNVTGGQVDLNVIPAELVERTDVLTVGGAVAYGSDAIAGVVNIILKDNFEGISTSARTGISSRGDLASYQLGVVAGKNFAEDRGNIAVAFQYNRDDGLQGNQRSDFGASYIAPTFFGNGAVRNRAFAPAIPIDVTNANNGAFLRATDDGQPGNRFLPIVAGGSILLSEGGSVFQFTGTLPSSNPNGSFSAIVAGVQAGAIQSLAGNTQAVAGTGVSSATSAALGGNAPSIGNPATLPPGTFTRFAPSTLPAGVSAATIVASLAPAFVVPPGTTSAQLNTLALNLLQANRPTQREYLAANPNTPINAFLGSTIPAFLDVANTDPASRDALPRSAVPLRFDNNGALVTYSPGRFDATTPATLGGMPGGDFYNQTGYVVLRTQQDRYIGNMFGHFDLTPNLTFYTENLYARVENVALRNLSSANTLGSGGTENAVIVASINNPFLNATTRQTLVNAGVNATTGLFALSRTNQDITGANQAFTQSDTLRTVNGLKGDFGLFGKAFTFDTSFTYGQAKAEVGTTSIRDVEYALALDAVVDPAGSGRIVCRVQTPNASTALPLGVTNSVLVREAGPDGVLVEKLVARTVTAAQVSGCAPLNPFGFDLMSQEAKNYVTFKGVAKNRSEQMFLQGSVATGNLFGLPAGGVGLAVNGEWRKETLDYRPSDEQRLGVSRTAALAATQGEVTSIEGSIEALIPIFGGDITFPLMRSLDFSPGVRFVKQDGNAPDVIRLNGNLETNEAKGKWESLYTLGGIWKPFDDMQVRGNYTRSIRQPSVVELFLGNQPAFNTPTDPCGIAQIGAGSFAANRRANCEQEVVRLGIAPDRTAAAAFLSTFVPAGQALQGGFSGSSGLKPEKGRSWTVGALISPHFVPGFTLSADYIDVEVLNQIIPTTLSNAAQFCYDSSTFGTTEATLGVNTCSFFDRAAVSSGGATAFNIQNGFASGFINLGALQVRSVNASAEYGKELSEIFGGDDNGRIRLRVSVYRLIDYISSAAGDFTDSQNSAGSFFRPKWETQVSARYENDSIFAQWTWNQQSSTKFFDGNLGAFATPEQRDVVEMEAFGLHDASVGYTLNDKFGIQLTVRNMFDKRYAGISGFATGIAAVGNSGEVDIQGRRYQLTARARF